jgi:hypothetical protein
VLLRSEHLDELLAMQPTAEIDSAMADLAEALLRGVTETVAAEVPRKLGTIVHKSIPTLIQAVDLYREVEGQLSISSRNFLLHSLRSIILMLQADDDLDKLSQAINDDADVQANFLESLVLLIVTCSDHDVQLTTVRNSP